MCNWCVCLCILYKHPFPFLFFCSTGRQLDKLLLHWRSPPYYSPLLVLCALLFSCVAFVVIWRNKVLNLLNLLIASHQVIGLGKLRQEPRGSRTLCESLWLSTDRIMKEHYEPTITIFYYVFAHLCSQCMQREEFLNEGNR